MGRARGFYEAAWPLVPLLEPAGRAVFLVMARTYRGLLDLIERRDFDVFTDRVRLSRWTGANGMTKNLSLLESYCRRRQALGS